MHRLGVSGNGHILLVDNRPPCLSLIGTGIKLSFVLSVQLSAINYLQISKVCQRIANFDIVGNLYIKQIDKRYKTGVYRTNSACLIDINDFFGYHNWHISIIYRNLSVLIDILTKQHSFLCVIFQWLGSKVKPYTCKRKHSHLFDSSSSQSVRISTELYR